MTSTMQIEVGGQTGASRAPRPHGTWQGADLLAPSEFESFLDDYLMSTVEGGGAVPGEPIDKQQLRQQQSEQRRQGPAAQLRSNPLASRWSSQQPATSLFIPASIFPCTGPSLGRVTSESPHCMHATACMPRTDERSRRLRQRDMLLQVCSRREDGFAGPASVAACGWCRLPRSLRRGRADSPAQQQRRLSRPQQSSAQRRRWQVQRSEEDAGAPGEESQGVLMSFMTCATSISAGCQPDWTQDAAQACIVAALTLDHAAAQAQRRFRERQKVCTTCISRCLCHAGRAGFALGLSLLRADLDNAAPEWWRSMHDNLVQAKVSELEQQVDELNQRISLQTTEKANLDSRVNILVRVLRMRDEEIAQLQQKLKVGPWSIYSPMETALRRTCLQI